MRRNHLVLLGIALFGSCLCFLLLQQSTPEAQAPSTDPISVVVGEAPAADDQPRALHDDARVNNSAVEHADVEQTNVASAHPPAVILASPRTAKPPPAFIAGIVVVPGEWELRSFRLEFDDSMSLKPLRVIESSEMQGVPGRADGFSWSLPGVLSGRYRVFVVPTYFSLEFDVGPEGRQDIEIDVPPPSSIEVLVVDARTKAPSRVHWLDLSVLMKQPTFEQLVMTQSPFEQLTMHGTWSGRSQENDMKTGLFRFKAPQGSSVWLRSRSTVWKGAPTTATDTFRELGPGRNKFELFTNDVGGFVLQAKDGNDFINWPPDCTVEADAIDGAGTVQVWDDDGARGHRAFVSLPGRYRCRLSKIKGFKLLDPFEVDVLEGEFKRVTLDLKRD